MTSPAQPMSGEELLVRCKKILANKYAWENARIIATAAQALLTRIETVEAEIKRLEANQRTAGTVEVCERYWESYCEYEAPSNCTLKVCPIRTAQQGVG